MADRPVRNRVFESLRLAGAVLAVAVFVLPIHAEAPARAELLRRSVELLVELQEPDGQWAYEGVYRVERQIPVGYRVGGTAIVADTLLYAAPNNSAAKAAIAKAIPFVLKLLEHPLMVPSTKEGYDVRVWGHACALEFFCHLRAAGIAGEHAAAVVAWIPKLVATLVTEEISGGGWNYASRQRHASFVTAPVTQALLLARSQGEKVPDEVLSRARKVLEECRSSEGAFAYSGTGGRGRPGDKVPGSAARSAVCEVTLRLLGGGSLDAVRAAIDIFHTNWDELKKRHQQTGTHVPPYMIAPYYFYYGHRYAAQAIEMLPAAERAKERERLLAVILKTRDADGTWNDRVFPRSRAYGTAMCVLALLGEQVPLPAKLEPPRQIAAAAKGPDPVTTVLAGLPARNIGPSNMGGRIADVGVAETDPNTWYIGVGNGGVWKTTTGGNNWLPVFDQQDTLCIGAVAVAPSDANVVYVGTGEANPRNSVSWGHGIYKSVDGGKTWSAPVLPDSHHVGRIVVHPNNPDVAYAAILGHLWAPNKDRGLYKTVDGGQSWQLSKFLDDNTGFVDVAIDPSDPETLYAAAYPVRRDGFSGGSPRSQWGPNGGLYRTGDGGKTWTKMGGGLPDRPCGRCGISIYRKDPRIVYAIVQTDKTENPNDNRGQAANSNDEDIEYGGVFRSEDKGRTWQKVNDLVPRPFYYGQIRVDPNDDKRVYVLGVQFFVSSDGGETFNAGRGGTHSDHHALWIDPRDSHHVILGNDGGLYESKDKTRSWEALRGMAIGQFYGVAVDMRTPYRVYGGLQDNGSWGGPTATDRADGITMADWRRVGGGDGFRAAVDPTDPDTVYVESQGGNLQRVNLRTLGTRGGRGAGAGKAAEEDAPQGKAAPGKAAQGKTGGRRGTGQLGGIRPRAERDGPAYRFNWNSPLLLSPHDPKTLYFGGNFLFRSTNRGDRWERISPDLTRGAEARSAGHTLTAIAESPLKAGVLYAGTDDGKLHVTRDGGQTWTDLSEKIPGVPQDRWITSVDCSHTDEGTAYLTIDRHRNDDLKPYVFKTTDYGETWTSLANDLPPRTPVHVVRGSSKNPNLLFVGTEHGLFASLDAGGHWRRVTNGLPPAVTIHDLVIHPRDRELVIGTHARSIYVMDIAPLEELTDATVTAAAHLFAVKPVVATEPWPPQPAGDGRVFKGENPPHGAKLAYWLSANTGPVTLAIADEAGKTVATWDRPGTPGFHQVIWDLRPSDGKDVAAVGEYTVTLKTAAGARTRKLRLDPQAKPAARGEDKDKADLDKLAGTWSCVSGVNNGRPIPDATVKELRLTLTKERYKTERGEDVLFDSTYTIDATKEPKHINMIGTEGENKGKAAQGIYLLDGDTLKICYTMPGKERPTAFESKPDSGATLVIWKRAKP